MARRRVQEVQGGPERYRRFKEVQGVQRGVGRWREVERFPSEVMLHGGGLGDCWVVSQGAWLLR